MVWALSYNFNESWKFKAIVLAIAIQGVVEAVNYLNLVAEETAIDISQVKLGTEHLNPAQNLKSAV